MVFTLPFRNAPTPGPFDAQAKRGKSRASDPRWPFRIPFATPMPGPSDAHPGQAQGKPRPGPAMALTLPFRNAPTPGPFGAQDNHGEGRAPGPRWALRIPFATPHARPLSTRKPSAEKAVPRTRDGLYASLSHRSMPGPFDAQAKREEGRASGTRLAQRSPFASPHCRPFRRTPRPSTGKAAPRARDDPTLPFRNAHAQPFRRLLA